MSKYTPGPWHFDTTGQGSIDGPKGSDHPLRTPNPTADRMFGTSQRLAIARLIGWGEEHDAEKHGEQRLANGHLISAAPDFLAACEGPGEDVTPLEWLHALLAEIRESNWADGREDVSAAWEAVYQAETLLENLAKATRKAKGE